MILAEGRVRVSDQLSRLSAPADGQFVANVIGDSHSLVEGLNEFGIEHEVQHDGSVHIQPSGDESFQQIWKICEQRDIVLSSLAPTRNSLEEIFMAAIRGTSNADS